MAVYKPGRKLDGSELLAAMRARKKEASRLAGSGWSKTPVLERICAACPEKECKNMRALRRSCKVEGYRFAPKGCPFLCEHVIGGQD